MTELTLEMTENTIKFFDSPPHFPGHRMVESEHYWDTTHKDWFFMVCSHCGIREDAFVDGKDPHCTGVI